MKFKGSDNYVATDDLMLAVNAAITLTRPLLVKGEPGTGKTMLAEEVASQIFYRCTERFSEKQILFGVVNSVNPGTFDLDRMKDLKTPGISLFMRLPAPIDSLKAFNIMLDCAQNLASFLNAEIHNEYHSVLTKQTIDHMREEIQLYSLRHAQLRKA